MVINSRIYKKNVEKSQTFKTNPQKGNLKTREKIPKNKRLKKNVNDMLKNPRKK